MNCPKCGNEAPDGAAMCKVCSYVFPIGLRNDGEPSYPGVPMPRPPAQQPAPAQPPRQPLPARPQAPPAQMPHPAQPQAPQPAQPQAPHVPAQQPVYQPPPSPQTAAQPAGAAPGIVTERSAVTTILLGMVTCGIYIWYWWYKTTDELKRATGDQGLNPGMDILLVVLTGGLWGVYVEYRNAKKVHEILAPRDPGRKDQSQTILIMRLVGLVIPFTAFYAIYLTQEEYNALARTLG